MKISIPTFRGRAPRVSPRALADGYGVIADSTRLLSGDLEPWKERLQIQVMPKPGRVNTIYRLASRVGDTTPFWLHWTDGELAAGETNVDVALGPEPADQDVATYFTGTTLGPRYTNKFLATDESQRPVGVPVGAYPYASRPLLINAPTVAPTIVQTLPVLPENQVTYSATGASTAPFTYIRTGGPYGGISVQSDPDASAPGDQLETPRIFVNWRNGGGALVLWSEAYDLANSNAIEFSINLDTNPPSGGDNSSEGDMSVVLFAAESGVGPRIQLAYKSAERARYIDTAGNNTAMTFETAPGVPLVIDGNQPITVRVTGTKNVAADGAAVSTWTLNITLVNYTTGATMATMTGVTATVAGDQIGVIGNSGASGNNTIGYFNGLTLTTTLAPDEQPVPVFTSYVYTLVNDLGWESAPSPTSVPVTVDNGITNTVTIPAQTEPSIVAVRLYRAAVGLADADFLFVAEIPPPYPAVYADTTPSSALGEALITELFDVPPLTLRGLLALPGGALAGFSGNQLCFSEPEYPYAWPVSYRLTTDFNIVAIAAINSSVVVLTEAFVYIASGNRPGDYAMEKLEYPQGCVSKRSVAYVSGAGVLYASPDGLYSVTGSGPPRNTTELLFSRREWQALNPSSLIGAAHDDRYFGFYQRTDGSRGGFILDFRQPGGFGLIDIPDHATAVYADPITDVLYFTEDGPTLDLQIAPASINLGQSATLTWESQNATDLVASGAWSGAKAETGSQSVTPTAAGTLTYTLAGGSAIGPISDSVTLTVINPGPSVQFAAATFNVLRDGGPSLFLGVVPAYQVNLSRTGSLAAASVRLVYGDEIINLASPGSLTELQSALVRLSPVSSTSGVTPRVITLPLGLSTIPVDLVAQKPSVGVRMRNDLAFPTPAAVREFFPPLQTSLSFNQMEALARPSTAPQNSRFLAKAMVGSTAIGRLQGFAGAITMNLRTNNTRSNYAVSNAASQASDFAASVAGIDRVFVFAASVAVGRTTDPSTNWLPQENNSETAGVTDAAEFGYNVNLGDNTSSVWEFNALAAGNKLEIPGISRIVSPGFDDFPGQFLFSTATPDQTRALRFVVAVDDAPGGAISVGPGWTQGGALVDADGRAVTMGYQSLNLQYQDAGLGFEYVPVAAQSNSVWTRSGVDPSIQSVVTATPLIISGNRLTTNGGGTVRNVVSTVATVAEDGSFTFNKPTSAAGDGIVVIAVAMAPDRGVNGLLLFNSVLAPLGEPPAAEINIGSVNP